MIPAYASLTELGTWAKVRESIDLRIETAAMRPTRFKRQISTWLRAYAPILRLPGVAIVSKHKDVRDVLSDTAHFETVYAPAMRRTTGDFILGMPDTPDYRRLSNLLRSAVSREDTEWLVSWTSNVARELIAAAQPAQRFDLVGGFSRAIPMRLEQDYIGLTISTNQIREWTRSIFHDIFTNFCNDPVISAKARAAARALESELDRLIADVRAKISNGQTLPNTFLARMVANAGTSLQSEVLRRLAAGLVVSVVEGISNSISYAVEYLVDHPADLDTSRQAAIDSDDELLHHCVFEAMRFNTQNPFLPRRCRKSVTLAPETPRATFIREGTLVLAGTASAMFDEDYFPDAERFKTDRNLDSYLHFGAGMHQCFGRHIAPILVIGAMKELLLLDGLRRATGTAGRMTHHGAYCEQLIVEFDAPAASRVDNS